jgi:hypothetical protein
MSPLVFEYVGNIYAPAPEICIDLRQAFVN